MPFLITNPLEWKENTKKLERRSETIITPSFIKEDGIVQTTTILNWITKVIVVGAKPHGLAYSFVGIQTLYLATNFPEVFWNCACLIVNAGGAELIEADDSTDEEDDEKKKNKSVNYGKISTAIGETQKKGIPVLPPDINRSSLIFTPDLERNSIVYGLKGM